jgi:hypothetical protein
MFRYPAYLHSIFFVPLYICLIYDFSTYVDMNIESPVPSARNHAVYSGVGAIITMFSLAIVTSLAVSMIFVGERFFSLFLRISMWDFFGISFIMEVLSVCLPGIPDSLYTVAYVVGYVTVPVLLLIGYALDISGDFRFVSMAITSNTLAPIIVAMFCVLGNRLQRGTKTTTTMRFASNPSEHLVPYDMYSMAFVREEQHAAMRKVDRNSFGHATDSTPTQLLAPLTLSSSSGASLGAQMWSDQYHEANSQLQSANISLEVPDSAHSRLFNIFRRYICRRPGGSGDGVLLLETKRSLVIHVLWMYLFLLFFNVYFVVLEYFAMFFLRSSRATEKLVWFTGFFVVGSVIRVFCKRIGMVLDCGKTGTVSMYFIGEVYTLLFYYSFYRILFESVDDWSVFVIMQLIHVSGEWVLYPLRARDSTFELFRKIESSEVRLKGLLLNQYTDAHDWLHFIALDYGLKTVIVVATLVGMMAILSMIDVVPWVAKRNILQQSRGEEGKTVVLLMICLVVELVNAYAMNSWFFIPRKISVRRVVLDCFSNQHFYLMTFLLTVCTFIGMVFTFSIIT